MPLFYLIGFFIKFVKKVKNGLDLFLSLYLFLIVLFKIVIIKGENNNKNEGRKDHFK